MLITLKCLHNIPACHKPLPARPLHFTPSRWRLRALRTEERGSQLLQWTARITRRVPRGVRNLTGARVPCPRLSSALYAEGVYELHRLARGGGRGGPGEERAGRSQLALRQARRPRLRARLRFLLRGTLPPLRAPRVPRSENGGGERVFLGRQC